MTAPKRAPEYGPAGSARSSLSAVDTLVRGLPLSDGAAVEVIETPPAWPDGSLASVSG